MYEHKTTSNPVYIRCTIQANQLHFNTNKHEKELQVNEIKSSRIRVYTTFFNPFYSKYICIVYINIIAYKHRIYRRLTLIHWSNEIFIHMPYARIPYTCILCTIRVLCVTKLQYNYVIIISQSWNIILLFATITFDWIPICKRVCFAHVSMRSCLCCCCRLLLLVTKHIVHRIEELREEKNHGREEKKYTK